MEGLGMMSGYMSMQNDLISAALTLVRAEIKSAVKTGLNPHLRSKYATEEDLDEVIRAPLVKHGLTLVHSPRAKTLFTMVLHKSGQWIGGETELLNESKNPMQGIGSALSYAKRYNTKSLLDIPVSDRADDDGHSTKDNRTEAEFEGVGEEIYDAGEYMIGFGKYKGKKLNEIPREDLIGYCKWAKENMEPGTKLNSLLEVARMYVGTTS